MSLLRVESIEGFTQLNAKLKRLDDKVTRREVLKIFRRLARPVVLKYRANLPKESGTLAKSVQVRAVRSRFTGGNPVIAINPGKSGRNDGYYRFMVIPKNTVLGSIKRGSRTGKNTVVPMAKSRTLSQVRNGVTRGAEKQTARFIQTQINRLST